MEDSRVVLANLHAPTVLASAGLVSAMLSLLKELVKDEASLPEASYCVEILTIYQILAGLVLKLENV